MDTSAAQPGARGSETPRALAFDRGTRPVGSTRPRPRLTTASAQWPPRTHSGDILELLENADGSTTIFVGDVAGNGPAAAAVAARSRPDVRRQLSSSCSPGRCLERLNDALESTLEANLFLTAVVARIDADFQTIQVASAGHLGPFLRRRSGSSVTLSAGGGPPLGIVRQHRYHQVAFSLAPGDTVVFATDGVTDRFATRSDFSGQSGLLAALDRLPGPAADICGRLLWSRPAATLPDASVLALQLPDRQALAAL
jgi:two-component system, chemotaxis family, sensor kinase Cph1